MELFCPVCKSDDLRKCETYQRPLMTFQTGEAMTTVHFGDLNDYTCRNCDFKFLVEQDEIDQAIAGESP